MRKRVSAARSEKMVGRKSVRAVDAIAEEE